MSLCYEVISSFVIVAVLDLPVGGCRPYTAMFFTIIFALFLHDLASAYQISSKQNHSRQTYDVISISKNLNRNVAMELEIHPRLRF